MSNNTYTFQTPEHAYDFVPVSADLVHVRAESREALEEFLNTLELAGMAEQDNATHIEKMQRFMDLWIEESDTDYDHIYYIEITRADLALYLQFEVLNYMGAVTE